MKLVIQGWNKKTKMNRTLSNDIQFCVLRKDLCLMDVQLGAMGVCNNATCTKTII